MVVEMSFNSSEANDRSIDSSRKVPPRKKSGELSSRSRRSLTIKDVSALASITRHKPSLSPLIFASSRSAIRCVTPFQANTQTFFSRIRRGVGISFKLAITGLLLRPVQSNSPSPDAQSVPPRNHRRHLLRHKRRQRSRDH